MTHIGYNRNATTVDMIATPHSVENNNATPHSGDNATHSENYFPRSNVGDKKHGMRMQ